MPVKYQFYRIVYSTISLESIRGAKGVDGGLIGGEGQEQQGCRSRDSAAFSVPRSLTYERVGVWLTVFT